MRANIYTDLDSTLIHPVGPSRTVFSVRPGTEWFLRNLSMLGRVVLLTHGTREHARRSLRIIPGSRHISAVIAREDMDPVDEALTLGLKTTPIAPSGPIFDDQPLRSYIGKLKGGATGLRDPLYWIEVEGYDERTPDRKGLKKAFAEFIRRFS